MALGIERGLRLPTTGVEVILLMPVATGLTKRQIGQHIIVLEMFLLALGFVVIPQTEVVIPWSFRIASRDDIHNILYDLHGTTTLVHRGAHRLPGRGSRRPLPSYRHAGVDDDALHRRELSQHECLQPMAV